MRSFLYCSHMKFSKNRQIGNVGEDIACEILKRSGYLIIGRNYLRKTGEIDIIAQKDDVLVFFEVKSLILNEKHVSHGTYMPEHNISAHKLRKIHTTIAYFLREYAYNDIYWECHGISIVLDKDLNLINHYIIRDLHML